MTRAQFIAAMTKPVSAPHGTVCSRCHHWTYAPIPVRHIPRPSHAAFFGSGPTPEDEMNAW